MTGQYLILLSVIAVAECWLVQKACGFVLLCSTCKLDLLALQA